MCPLNLVFTAPIIVPRHEHHLDTHGGGTIPYPLGTARATLHRLGRPAPTSAKACEQGSSQHSVVSLRSPASDERSPSLRAIDALHPSRNLLWYFDFPMMTRTRDLMRRAGTLNLVSTIRLSVLTEAEDLAGPPAQLFPDCWLGSKPRRALRQGATSALGSTSLQLTHAGALLGRSRVRTPRLLR